MRYISVRAQIARILLLLFLALASIRALAAGWTPTDGGLVLNLEQGDRFLLSVWVDTDGDGVEDEGEEFFVINYNRYTGGYFNYTSGSYLKLAPQEAGATEPSDMSIWQVGAPLVRGNYALGGIVYTVWNDGKTLKTGNNTNYQFLGDLTSDYNDANACDAVFVLPTDRVGVVSFDPNNTLGRNAADTLDKAGVNVKGRFNGHLGTGFLGMHYREVYWLEIPRGNQPRAYTNAALVTFNRTLSQKSWSNRQINCAPGHAAYAYADDKHKPTTRTVFRIYMLDDPINSCGSYFFATDVQNKNKKYRKSETMNDSTPARKIYTWDRFYCMEHVGDASSKIYKSGYMNVPAGATSKDDSTFYYVGKNDTYVNEFNQRAGYLDPTGTAVSQFKYIDSLRIFALKDSLQPNGKPFIAPAGAYGRMVVDTTSTKQNLDVAFEPKGYFFQTNSGANVNMRQVDDSTWMVDEMWYIDPTYMALQARIMLYTGAEFNSSDAGAAIAGWSVYVNATDIPVVGSTETASGKYGWARIHTNRAAQNGGMEFVEADQTKHVHYDNNGHFGASVPDQYPEVGKTNVAVQAPRLMEGYEFLCWTDVADTTSGSFTKYHPGDPVTLSGVLTLYAQARYTGSIHVAISFMKDGQRYFLTHPSVAPRYASIRHFEDWENVWQGMADINNSDPNYISTYKIIGKETTCAECDPDEYVLDPRNETMKGAVDSLVFYENFHPDKEEYIGLYYTSPSYIIANNTWAGLFTSSNGWPTPARACVSSTQLASDSYLERNGGGVITRYERTVTPKDPSAALLPANIQYNSVSSVFDGVAEAGTDFMISGVGVVDEHYIILPDTSAVWRDTIEFGFHEGVQTREDVWSKLIGKQLLAQMKVGDDTIYFHPNRNKIINDPNELYLSQDFRVTQLFSFIRDSRVTSIHSDDQVSMEATSNYWHYNIISGLSSPIDIKDARGNYVDVVDTFRIELSHGNISKVKKYYGRWADDAPGMYFSGTNRVRDIIVRTKTYHYEPEESYLVLTPTQNQYVFNPLRGNSHQLDFTLTKVTTHRLVDVEGNFVRLDTVSIEDVTPSLSLRPSSCSFGTATTGKFAVVNDGTVSDHVTLQTTTENKAGETRDTLVVTTNVTVGGKTYNDVTVRVPLVQTPLEADELIWSVEYNNQRYFIMAGSGGLIFRRYNYKSDDQTLYKLNNNNVHLVIGSDAGDNSDGKYLTPWKYTYNKDDSTQLSLKTEYDINKYINIENDTARISDAAPCYFTYRYVDVHVNANANEEEVVRLKYLNDKWLKFSMTGGVGHLTLVADSLEGSVFSWTYLQREYDLTDNGTYPSLNEATFGYNSGSAVTFQTRYKALKRFSTLLGNQQTYLAREAEDDVADLVNPSLEWRTDTLIEIIPDGRDFDGTPDPVSGLYISNRNTTTLQTTIRPTSATSPLNVTIGGKYVNIVDTLHFKISLQAGAPEYRFFGKWSWMKSLDDAELKLPLIRKTYHRVDYDSIVCLVANDEGTYTFPSKIEGTVTHTFTLSSDRRTGAHVLNVDNEVAAVVSPTHTNVTTSGGMDLSNPAKAEIRLVDEYGNTPDWCAITGKTATTLTVQCLKDGIRSPRSAYIYLAYILMIDDDGNDMTPEVMRFINYRMTITQPSYFNYADNQHLVHSKGASGDSIKDGMQQVHENKRILYYYPDQDVELPVREAHFFGWWRWYREGTDEYGTDVGDQDVPDSLWRKMPTNTGGKYNYPFRRIGDSVYVDEKDHSKGKKLMTMGRYTVFHYRSKDYPNVRVSPPLSKVMVAPPDTMHTGVNRGKPATLTYAVDISNYYDNLPMSLSQKNQVDTACMDTMRAIPEPTLSLREVFELRPWTEMAERLEGYKSTRTTNDAGEYPLATEKYMEDHVVMAPIGNRLLLKTEQRYNLDNVWSEGHSESLLGYFMCDDNWGLMSAEKDEDGWSRQDSMIWCGGWDADCEWYTYDPKTQTYTPCTHSITKSDDFLNVPAKGSISEGNEFDTVYYCLRARSWKSTFDGSTATSVPGDNMFNICRYKIIYHDNSKYGPLPETKKKGVNKALITNEEIEQRYEILEKLNFDYNEPGSDFYVYPHPLPWADASYGYTYPETSALPHNRLHDQTALPNFGEYGLINRIPEASHWSSGTSYWHPMEQHGGADKGYMIYCDGMSSAGQVAALRLDTTLCDGQKMFFSAYVANPYISKDTKYARPNFTFSVQGRIDDRSEWADITSYMTGDLEPSDKWYQIYFPIIDVEEGMNYTQFRIKIFNMASNWDGNDFIIDDMCIFATKPPLLAYQASTVCKEHGDESSDTHVILRLDYQGITGDGYNGRKVYYTVKQVDTEKDTTFLPMSGGGYLEQEIHKGKDAETADTICGKIFIPAKDYEPEDEDSIYANLNEFIVRYDSTSASGKYDTVQVGYIYEVLEGSIRPVKYIIHNADMPVENEYTVHMSLNYTGLLSSICGMTSRLNVTDRMVLAIDGEEQPKMEVTGMCANATYELGLHVKGSMYVDSVAPIELTGTCYNDWLLYGDTADATSEARYGYKYSDIEKVIKDVLRYEPMGTKNRNQFASNFSAIKRKELDRMQAMSNPDLTEGVVPYELLKHLVENGFLILYKSTMTVTVQANDSVEYVIFPISGTGTDALHNTRVDVCTVPIHVKLSPKADTQVPLILGGDGITRKPTDADMPVVLLMDEMQANSDSIFVKIDSIMTDPLAGGVAIDSIYLYSCNDPEFRPGVHKLEFVPDREYSYTGGDNTGYYVKHDSIRLRPAPSTNYQMRGGYRYTFVITLRSRSGDGPRVDAGGCSFGKVPFTIGVVPSYLRWDPQSEDDNRWNNPDNWIGITPSNTPINEEARFAPLSSTYVVIPPLADTLPYPTLPKLPVAPVDSIHEVGFTYNKCSYIRFMVGAAMSQQQRMRYEQAIVDLSLPHDKWAFRTSPVAGMISGDLFMAQADINWETSPWEVGAFDANGRNYRTGTGSFWLSMFNQSVIHQGSGSMTDTTHINQENWSQVTNGLTQPLPAGLGWAVYTRTPKNNNATVRLPKNDDIYYYYNQYGDKMYDLYEPNLQALRATVAGGVGAGKLLFNPDPSEGQSYTLTNTTADTIFIFGNPTMGYIDIWGFLDDNSAKLVQQFKTINEKDASLWPVTRASVLAEPNRLSNTDRYLPPMHAIALTTTSAPATTLTLKLDSTRIVTDTVPDAPAASPIRRSGAPVLSKGIMRITATNDVDERCTTHLLLGQGYHKEVRAGEDALLTTINIEKYTVTGAPATPFNIYALEGNSALSINLLDSIVNVPVSFMMTENLISAFEPITNLWFSGVNNISEPLVLYDALTDTERPIMDGICIRIETPQVNNLARYYIRRRGYRSSTTDDPATGVGIIGADEEKAIKFIQNGIVYILRSGHVYTVLGQKIK